MEIDDLIAPVVAHHHDETALIGGRTVFDQRPHAGVDLLADHVSLRR